MMLTHQPVHVVDIWPRLTGKYGPTTISSQGSIPHQHDSPGGNNTGQSQRVFRICNFMLLLHRQPFRPKDICISFSVGLPGRRIYYYTPRMALTQFVYIDKECS
ncbi:hypothetical protein FRX31_002042 [Thalictrum thalictroides]|uniref:Uncharacterized protein n=1 Tax=Thalictrum thalictroides TaxID=46969 RepID=A0A7J6XHZ8_THATH|nr:hypothetical protein FRX31_002042 [Thalictrum thalictroides]